LKKTSCLPQKVGIAFAFIWISGLFGLTPKPKDLRIKTKVSNGAFYIFNQDLLDTLEQL